MSEKAIRLNKEAWAGSDSGSLSFLDQKLSNKRIFFLGEPDHYIHEKYDYRLLFIKYLVNRGWKNIGMEMGRSDGKRINKYLQTGDIRYLKQVTLYGHKKDARQDRDDSISGFAARSNKRFREAFINEEIWFLNQIWQINAKLPLEKKVYWFGYDIDILPGGVYSDTAELLRPYKNLPSAKQIFYHMALKPGESRMQEVKRIKKLLIYLERFNPGQNGNLPYKIIEEIRYSFLCHIDSLRFVDAVKDGPLSGRWVKGLIKREKTMSWQMDRILENLAADEKVLLLGHNMHLSKVSDQVAFDGLPMWPSIGNHLNLKMPGSIYSVWMLYDHGQHVNIMARNAFTWVYSDPDRIEHLLSGIHPVFILPLEADKNGGKFLDSVKRFVINGSSGSGILNLQADALFFVSEVSAPKKRN